MYKTAVRALLRYSIGRLNEGDYSLMLKMAHPDFELTFPGNNSWSTMFRPHRAGRQRHPTHIGLAEASAFADRLVDERLQFEVEDILVNGPPWNMRVAARVCTYIEGPSEHDDTYNNRAVLLMEMRWGRLVRWEDYEDTERVSTWDAQRAEQAQV